MIWIDRTGETDSENDDSWKVKTLVPLNPLLSTVLTTQQSVLNLVVQ